MKKFVLLLLRSSRVGSATRINGLVVMSYLRPTKFRSFELNVFLRGKMVCKNLDCGHVALS